jgi:hypothetical protein
MLPTWATGPSDTRCSIDRSVGGRPAPSGRRRPSVRASPAGRSQWASETTAAAEFVRSSPTDPTSAPGHMPFIPCILTCAAHQPTCRQPSTRTWRGAGWAEDAAPCLTASACPARDREIMPRGSKRRAWSPRAGQHAWRAPAPSRHPQPLPRLGSSIGSSYY